MQFALIIVFLGVVNLATTIWILAVLNKIYGRFF
jgi:hypothetical protein